MRVLFFVLGILAATPILATTPPTLFQHAPARKQMTRGVHQLYPIDIDQDAAKSAIKAGGFWFNSPDGTHTFVRYVRDQVQADGNWTWIGTVDTRGGQRSVVITFGTDATFGTLVTSNGRALRISSTHGQAWLIGTNKQLAAARAQRKIPSRQAPDYRAPPVNLPNVPARSQAFMTSAASNEAHPVVDVLLGYTPGLVTELGSVSGVKTRFDYLVALTNRAYEDSGVHGRIRLVGTLQVNYPDDTSDDQTLNDLADNSGSSPLQSLRQKRDALGADLVSLVRPFLHVAQQGDCGLGYLNGYNLSPFNMNSAPYGYSTVSDGVDDGYYCLDTTLAHELGHNMGLAHDQDDSDAPGAFTYAYGWRKTLPSDSFYTIMAYRADDQWPVDYFANPDISLCNGNPCGDPTVANQTLALNQTMPVVAGFRDTPNHPRIDINADGYADLLLSNSSTRQVTYLLMQNGTAVDSKTIDATPGTLAVAADLDGNRATDLVWTTSSGELYVWSNDGGGNFTTSKAPSYPTGWKLIGSADINHDSRADLLWFNAGTHQFAYWLMNGAKRIGYRIIKVTPGYRIAAVNDFNADGFPDLVWTSDAHDLYLWTNDTHGGFISTRSLDYPAGWTIEGSGNINGDADADLLWLNTSTHQYAYWTMNGARRTGYTIKSIAPGYHIAAADEYHTAASSLLWTSANRDLYLWKNKGNGTFTSSRIQAFPASQSGQYDNTYPSGWQVFSPAIRHP